MTLTTALTRHLKCPELFLGLADGADASAGEQRHRIGREGSRHGLEDYLEMKYLSMGGL